MFRAFLPAVLCFPFANDSFLFYFEVSEVGATNPTTESRFGNAVAIDGNTAIVGSPAGGGNSPFAGAVYMYERTSTGWGPEQRLLPTDSVSGDEFGASVAVQGNLAFVGAPRALSTGGTANGAVYVFERSGGVWIQRARIQPTDTSLGDRFGGSLEVSGNSILIGATGAQTTVGSGKAYVFVGQGAIWAEQDQLVPPSAALSGSTGTSVSISGDLAVVGAPSAEATEGRALVYQRSGSMWMFETALADTSPLAGARFATSVALDGDTAIVGGPDLTFGFGGARAFVRAEGTWDFQGDLVAPNVQAGSGFGGSIEIEGNRAAVGAPDQFLQGAAYVFERTADVWALDRTLTSPGLEVDEDLGASVALSGDVLLAGDPTGDDVATDAGLAVFFERLPTASGSTTHVPQNAASYTSNLIVLRSTWHAMVDLTTTGHAQAFVFFYGQPDTQPLPGGQVLLIDLNSTFFAQLGPQAGPVAIFSEAVPNDLSLAGQTVVSQAVHLGGVTPFALSNQLGFCIGFGF